MYYDMKYSANVIHDIENNRANQKQINNMFGSSFDSVCAEDENEDRIRGIEFFKKSFNGYYYTRMEQLYAEGKLEEIDYAPFKYADELRKAYESEE